MKLFCSFTFLYFFILSCENSPKGPEIIEESIEEAKLSLKDQAKRHVESQLSIPGTENYTLRIEKAQFDNDGLEDAVILVNREEFAIKSATENKKSLDSELNFTGNFNHLFYFDGATQKISRPINIGSSAFSKLKIGIENIQSDIYKDFTLDYRILENCYRNFYTIVRGVPKLVFQWPIFILEQEAKPTVNFIEFAKGSYSSAKDILIAKGKFDNTIPENIRKDFTYTISKVGNIDYLFFYNPNEGKYYTKKQK